MADYVSSQPDAPKAVLSRNIEDTEGADDSITFVYYLHYLRRYQLGRNGLDMVQIVEELHKTGVCLKKW